MIISVPKINHYSLITHKMDDITEQMDIYGAREK